MPSTTTAKETTVTEPTFRSRNPLKAATGRTDFTVDPATQAKAEAFAAGAPDDVDHDQADAEAAELAHTHIPELAATVRHKDALLAAHTGRGKSALIQERADAIEALRDALVENGLDREAVAHEVLDIARGTQTIASTNARLAAFRRELDEEQAPTEDEEIAARMAEERETYQG